MEGLSGGFVYGTGGSGFITPHYGMTPMASGSSTPMRGTQPMSDASQHNLNSAFS